jgi:hypothetical protein
MKNNNEAWLELEVLEDRATPGGGFSGAAAGGVPVLPSVVTGLIGNPLIVSSSAPGFRNTFTGTNFDSVVSNQVSNQAQTLQSQLQAFQAAQTAIVDQYFANLSTLVKALNLSTVLII